MADTPPPSYEGAVGKSDSEDDDPRVESGVIALHFRGVIRTDSIFGGERKCTRVVSVTVGGSSAEDTKIGNFGHMLKGKYEVKANLLAITLLTRAGYTVVNLTDSGHVKKTFVSRMYFVRK